MRNATAQVGSAVLILALCSIPAVAGKPPKPASAKIQGPKTTHVQAPKTTKSGAPQRGPGAQGPKSGPKAPKAPAGRSGATTTAAAKSKPAKGQPTAVAGTTTAPAGGSTAGTTTVAPVWTPNNPVAQKLASKPNLLARVQASLPAGTDLNAATAGFKNFGQFVAATNVSSNLGIDFSTLKASMTGSGLDGVATGQPTRSLGQSIQLLKPGVDGEAEAARAETLANQQIAGAQ
jgi:hypothetical protein